MTEYEFTFVSEPLTEAVEGRLAQELGAFVGGHGATTLITVSAEGDDALAVGMSLVHELRGRGVVVHRVYHDLVTRSQIAERAHVSRQAVGLWTRGERLAGGPPFPEPFGLAGGGLWMWSDVNAWLTEAGRGSDEVSYPDAMEIARLNTVLDDGARADDASRLLAHVP
ncbi:MAG: hypothetical protein Q4G67_04565 [Actinomycetia bacterium]|nr:hypothetical protein [Actinomycetes bacterium]